MDPPLPTKPNAARQALAVIAGNEAALGLAGNANMAGPAIERYLAVFREAMNSHASTDQYSNLETGYGWCCAFVYYCCMQAGYHFPPKPIAHARCTLAAVPSWREWAIDRGFFHPVGSMEPEKGDIVLLNRVYDGNPLDHIGIVVGRTADGVLCAEGNTGNRTGIFPRAFSVIEGFVRLPENAA